MYGPLNVSSHILQTKTPIKFTFIRSISDELTTVLQAQTFYHNDKDMFSVNFSIK